MSRFAILLPSLVIGGAERVCLTLAEEFVSSGYKVDLVLLQAKGPLLAAVPAGVRLIDLAAPRLRNAIRPLSTYFRRERPVAAFANVWPLTLATAIAAKASRSRTQVIAMHQNSLSSQYVHERRHSLLTMRAALRVELALAKRVVGCSLGVIEDLAGLAGVSPTRMSAVPNPVKVTRPVDGLSLTVATDTWHVPKGRRVLAVGNLKPQKNYSLLLDAYSKVKKGNDDRLIIIGEGEERARLEKEIEILQLKPWVVMPGQSECLEAYYETADLFVMSSKHEGLPTVMIEALGFGLPVVSTDCPFGPREILDNGRLGTLVPLDEPEILGAAIERGLAERVNRTRAIARADDFAPKAIGHKLLSLVARPALV